MGAPHPEPTAAAPAKADYRNAMACLGAAVNIITSDGPGGRAGFTASAVCSVTDEPPTLLVCLNRSASVHAAFGANGVLCVNVLAPGHEALSDLFGGKTPMAERFAAADWATLATGAPVLAGAAAAFDCRVVRSVAVGTHDVLFCEVAALARSGVGDGLVYFGRRYHGLRAQAALA
ncbi:MAG: pyrimidine utilization flavin reductase protein F [Comamonas sp.]